MIGKKVNISRETEKQFIIHELNLLGIHSLPNGEPLEEEDYYTLLHALSVMKEERL